MTIENIQRWRSKWIMEIQKIQNKNQHYKQLLNGMYNYPWTEYKGRSYYRWDTNNVCEGPKNILWGEWQ